VYSLEAWLHAVAHNSALSLLRGRRRATGYREAHEGAGWASGDLGDVHAERLEALLAALRSLPARQRRALVMREFEGRSYEEIAVRLGASNGAVRQLLNRARASVRERLATLIPAELVLRWASATGGAVPSGPMTLAGGGAFAAKLSSAIMLSALPAVAVNPLPGTAASPAPAHNRRPAMVRTASHPLDASAVRLAATVVVGGRPRLPAATTTAPRRIVAAPRRIVAAPRRMATAPHESATSRRPRAAALPKSAPGKPKTAAAQACQTATGADPARGQPSNKATPTADPGSGAPAMMAVDRESLGAGQVPAAGGPGASPGLIATTAGA
jgi:hypothetical protein